MNWKRSLIGIGTAVPIILLLAFGLTLDPRQLPNALPGNVAPKFSLEVMDRGDTIDVGRHMGDVVVINFWASWCLECRTEHRDLSETAKAYAGKGVHFYGILYNDTPDNGREWITMMGGQSYPTLVDRASRTAIDYGLSGVPETVIVDGKGVVAFKKIGAITKAELSQRIDEALTTRAARAGPPEM